MKASPGETLVLALGAAAELHGRATNHKTDKCAKVEFFILFFFHSGHAIRAAVAERSGPVCLEESSDRFCATMVFFFFLSA